MRSSKLPLNRPLTLEPILSLLVAVLVTASSLAGLLFQSSIYPTEALRRSFLANDVVNLFIGLPILLGSLWLTRKGRLLGLLFWPGALLYITYNAIAYALAMPFTLSFVLNLAQVVLSVYVIVRLLTGVDAAAVQARLTGKVPERLAGGVLAGFGILFFIMRAGSGVQALTGGVQGKPELAVAVADFLFMPMWVICGIALWRKRSLGYLSGAGLLFQGSMLFVGLLVFFIMQPLLSGAPFPVTDFVVILVMGMVCFVPLGLFIRGVEIKP